MEALPKDYIDYNHLKLIRAILIWEYEEGRDSEKEASPGEIVGFRIEFVITYGFIMNADSKPVALLARKISE